MHVEGLCWWCGTKLKRRSGPGRPKKACSAYHAKMQRLVFIAMEQKKLFLLPLGLEDRLVRVRSARGSLNDQLEMLKRKAGESARDSFESNPVVERARVLIKEVEQLALFLEEYFHLDLGAAPRNW